MILQKLKRLIYFQHLLAGDEAPEAPGRAIQEPCPLRSPRSSPQRKAPFQIGKNRIRAFSQ